MSSDADLVRQQVTPPGPNPQQGGGTGGAPLSSDADLVRQQVAQAAAASAAAPRPAAADIDYEGVVAGEAARAAVPTDMNLLPDETGATRYSDQNPVQPLRKFATAGKQFPVASNPMIVGFRNLVNRDGTPRMFKKVFENGKLIGYREMKTRPSQ